MWNQRVPDTLTVNTGTMPIRSAAQSMDGHYFSAFSPEDDVSVSSTFCQSPHSDSINCYVPNDLAGAGSQYSDANGSVFLPSHLENRNVSNYESQRRVNAQPLMAQSYNDCQMDHPALVDNSMGTYSDNQGLYTLNEMHLQGNKLSGNLNQSWVPATWNSVTRNSHSSWSHNASGTGQCMSQIESGDYPLVAPSSWQNGSSGAGDGPSQIPVQGNNDSYEVRQKLWKHGPMSSGNCYESFEPGSNGRMDTSVSYEESVTSVSSHSSRTMPKGYTGLELNGTAISSDCTGAHISKARNSVHSRKSRTSGSRQSKDRNSTSSGIARKDLKYITPSSSGSENGRRSSGKSDTSDARQRMEYQQSPGADGMYHCFFEGQDNCEHSPTKLKCNYDKYIDSHLRPHECKEKGCEELRFSSAACKLRHEREAHGSHGHGLKPFLCKYKDCERSKEGSGFPRSWNCEDHMKRIHHVNSPSDSNSPNQVQEYPPMSAQEIARKRQSVGARQMETSKKHKSTAQRIQAEPRSAESKLEKLLARKAELRKEWYQREIHMKQRVERVSGPDDAKNIHLLREEVSNLGNLTGLLTDIAAQLKGLGYSEN